MCGVGNAATGSHVELCPFCADASAELALPAANQSKLSTISKPMTINWISPSETEPMRTGVQSASIVLS